VSSSHIPPLFLRSAAAHALRAADFIHSFSVANTTAAQVEETCAA
jgi:hypothetical protein